MLLESHETANPIVSDYLNEIDHVFKKGKSKSDDSNLPKSLLPENKTRPSGKDSSKSSLTKGLGVILKAVDLSTGRKSGRKSDTKTNSTT